VLNGVGDTHPVGSTGQRFGIKDKPAFIKEIPKFSGLVTRELSWSLDVSLLGTMDQSRSSGCESLEMGKERED
jgi:hypothetical protein